MKRLYILFLFLVLFLVFSVPTYAQIRPGAITLSPIFGGYTFEGNQHLKTSPLYGIRGGYDFTKNIGAEILFNYVPSKYETMDDRRTNVYNYRAELLYYFMPDKQFVPFVAFGAGGTSIGYPGNESDKTRAVVGYGVGLKYFLFKNMALRGDVRHIVTDSVYNNLEYTFGVTFYFGGKEPVVAAAPQPPPPPPPPQIVDSDGDGVPDDLDKCPDTPKGFKVDKDGCCLDSDGDGVDDCLDKCPDTPKGFKVDKDGCCLDSDGDGVDDCLDKCPDTPKGAEVDKEGCPVVVVPKAAPAMTGKEKEIMEKGKVKLNVLFDTNKWNIKPKYHNELKEFADVMIKHPELKVVVIEGHTDNVGGAPYNMKLSQRRADSIKKYLVEKFGIDPNRLKAKGYGLTRPIASNKTAKGRQENRRVEAVVEYMVNQ
ncbi:MAG: outer membrane beta-barrel domain-containing protein [Syntrophorhabdaceae bacterium]|nr:outer membrane beta-barrel domain-containing protein [Syntrophorhabdaceae bacterium]